MIRSKHRPRLSRNLLIWPVIVCLGACGGCRSQPTPSPNETAPNETAPNETAPNETAPNETPQSRKPPSESAEPRLPAAEHPLSETLVDAELNTVGWDRLTQAPVVLLRVPELDEVLPIWIGTAEARAIQMALLDMSPPRPMTHDLAVQLLELTGAELESVIVHEIREGTYFGLLQVKLEGEETPRWVDTRPSDGLALAVRTGARIQVAQRLLEQIPSFDFQAPDSPDQVVQLLGFKAVTVQDDLRQEFDLPDRPGVVVIEASASAVAQGLRRGDLIVTAQDEPVDEPLDLLEAIVHIPTGEPLRLVCWRDGEELTLELNLVPPVDPSEKKTA